MQDIRVRQIDDAMVQRIKELARERQWSINEVILHALRFGLGMGGAPPERMDMQRDPHDVAKLAGTWNAEESRAFQEAMEAFDNAPDGSFSSHGKPGDEGAGG